METPHAATKSRNPYLIGAYAGILAAATNGLISRLPAYSDIIIKIFGVSVFATGATMFAATLFFAVRNRAATPWKLAIAAVAIATVMFSATTILIHKPDLSAYSWWPWLPILVHTAVIIPAAIFGPAAAKRFARNAARDKE